MSDPWDEKTDARMTLPDIDLKTDLKVMFANLLDEKLKPVIEGQENILARLAEIRVDIDKLEARVNTLEKWVGMKSFREP